MTTYHELLAQRDSLDKQISDALRAGIPILPPNWWIADYGLTAKDCGFDERAAPMATVTQIKPKAPAAIKYRGPNGEAWSGRGRLPGWLGSLIEDGHSCREYLVEKESA